MAAAVKRISCSTPDSNTARQMVSKAHQVSNTMAPLAPASVSAVLHGAFSVLPEEGLSCILTEAPDCGIVTSATKLCCTLGPSTRDVETISKLLVAGMQVARFDFTWGTPEYHQETLDNLRIAMAKTERTCAVAMETAGREVMVVNKAEGPICLQQGATVTLTCDRSAACGPSLIPVSTINSFEGQGIEPGSAIFVGQYLFTGSETTSAYLTVQQISGQTCTCVCNNTCNLDGLQLTVHIAGAHIPVPAFSAEDERIIATWGKRNEVDFVGVPFTTSAKDVEDCRALLARCNLSSTKVIAKIEDVDGLRAHQEIIEAADVIIFARGKLGTRLDPAKVFLAQKLLLRTCNMAGKPVIVTRVVDTMIDAPRPTRAEATDVANLVLDGADGILLGSETFRGKYPELAVQTVSAICRQAEGCFDSHSFYRATMDMYGRELFLNMSKAEALASSAVRAAEKSQAKMLIVFTVTGNTARMIAKYKPKQPILTVVCHTPISAQYSDAKLSETQARLVHSSSMVSFRNNHRHGNAVMRQCLAMRGVIPIMATPELVDSAELLEYAVGVGKSLGLIGSGDKVVVSSCPRKYGAHLATMEEMGVVSLVKVDELKGASSASQLELEPDALLVAA